MAIYKAGSDMTPLQNAAKADAKARRDAGPEARALAGRAPISNMMIYGGNPPTARAIDYPASKKAGRDVHVPVTDHPVSGTVVAERAEKVKSGKVKPFQTEGDPIAKIGNQRAGRAGTAGVIKGRVLREDKKPAAPKKRAAGVKDVRAALAGGFIKKEEAADLNKNYAPKPKKKK